jgi:hypothetical protein
MYKYDGMVSFFGFTIIIIALIGAAFGATEVLAGGDEGSGANIVEQTFDKVVSGNTIENADSEVTFQTTEISEELVNVMKFSISLNWVDEPDATNRHTNQPDEFSIILTTPDGTIKEEGPSTGGFITLDYTIDQEEDPENNGIGEYQIVVTCIDAGDHEPMLNFANIRTRADNGNAWDLNIDVKYMGPEVQEEAPEEQSNFLGPLRNFDVIGFLGF